MKALGQPSQKGRTINKIVVIKLPRSRLIKPLRTPISDTPSYLLVYPMGYKAGGNKKPSVLTDGLKSQMVAGAGFEPTTFGL